MNVNDYEKCALSTVITYYSSEELLVQKMCLMLDDDKFESEAHKLIWRTISSLVIEGINPNVTNIIHHLGEYLEAAGGEVYIRSLHDFLKQMKVSDTSGWETYVKVINTAGTLRHLGLILKEYYGMYEDFESLVTKVTDVNEFISKFSGKIQDAFQGTKTSYKPISSCVEREIEHSAKAKNGTPDITIIGMPSIEKYGIPYPASFGVLLGLRSMGKTQVALQIALGKAFELKENNEKGIVSINSLETPDYLIVRRMACCLAGIDSLDVKLGRCNESTYQRYLKYLDIIDGLPIEIDDNAIISTDEMVWNAIAQNLKYKRILGVSDYAELFSDTETNSEELRVRNIVKNHKFISRQTSSAEILITQVNNSVLMTRTKIAGIDRARYSGFFAHAADWAGEIWNPPQMRASKIDFQCPEDKDEDKAYMLLEKNKNGPLGDISFQWIPKYTQFIDEALPPGKIFDFPKNRSVEVVNNEECSY